MEPEDAPLGYLQKLRDLGLIPAVEHNDDTPVEPRAIDPLRNRRPIGVEWDLSSDEIFRLSVNVIELERRRGYR